MKNPGIYALEKEINAKLASLPIAKRPETTTRAKISSVAYQAKGHFQAVADSDNSVESVSVATATQWLSIH